MSETGNRPSMQDIADQIGVSRMTVSYALRNDPRIPASTRERVHEAAHKLGYRVNPLVAALMAQRKNGQAETGHGTLAVLMTGRKVTPAEVDHFLPGLRQRANERGYQIEPLFLDEKGMTGRRLTKILRTRQIYGVVIPRLGRPLALDLDWHHFAVVTQGYTLREPNFHRVVADLYHGALLAVQELLVKGYQRIGLVVAQIASENTHHLWLAAYQLAQRSMPARQRLPALLLEENGWETAFLRWGEKNQPDVVLINHSKLVDSLANLNVRVPKDMGLAFLDRKETALHRGMETTGVDQQWEAVGAALVDVVVARMHANERGVPPIPRTILIPPVWNQGKTATGR